MEAIAKQGGLADTASVWPAADTFRGEVIEFGKPLISTVLDTMEKSLHSCTLQGRFLPQAVTLCACEGDSDAMPKPETKAALKKMSNASPIGRHVAIIVALSPGFAPRLQMAERLHEAQTKAASAAQIFFEWRACALNVQTRAGGKGKNLLARLVDAVRQLDELLKSVKAVMAHKADVVPPPTTPKKSRRDDESRPEGSRPAEESRPDEESLRDFKLWSLLNDLAAGGDAARTELCNAILVSFNAIVAGGACFF